MENGGSHRAPERRAGERSTIKCPVEAHLADGRQLRGHTLDISATGALLVLTADPPLGEEFRLLVELPDDGPRLEIGAMAIRHADDGENQTRPIRLGVTFILPPIDAVRRIRSLIYQSHPA